jgi:hypothetical protein
MSLMPKYAEIRCDGCGQWEPTQERTQRAGRKELRIAGWTYRGPDDWCAECTKARKEQARVDSAIATRGKG